tara:strand:+ start:96 stop:200 length:105 start_codon:yes stop_codon:yes gene_type:complete
MVFEVAIKGFLVPFQGVLDSSEETLAFILVDWVL